ncbi:MAG: hypothetical protein ACOYA8_05335 [Clostridium sp.]|jgi:hypothetical protein
MQDFFYERIKARDTERFFRDFEYFKSLYPEQVRQAQRCVEEVCDEMEYEGSPIYDEYPDRIMLEALVRKAEQQLPKEKIMGKTDGRGVSGGMPKEEMAMALEENAGCLVRVPRGPMAGPGPVVEPENPWGVPGPGPVVEPENPWGVPGPDPVVEPENPWGVPGAAPVMEPERPASPFSARDLLAILLMNELQGRRCRFGKCK